ncbi:MAG TPA: hypothetical protein VFJ14_01775 [Nocardioidaceae bacterium]|nr:hypothetical protein [Nocardioidaceae bacterium]
MTATGRAARAKGHRAERAVVAFLRANGHPEAATTRHRLGHDGFHAPGDIAGVPGLVIEVKDVAASAFPTWCRQAEEEAQGTPWCVVRRQPGVTDVGAWPCVASLDAIAGPVHHSPLSLIQIVRRIDALPAGHWLAGRDGWAAGHFRDLFDGTQA